MRRTALALALAALLGPAASVAEEEPGPAPDTRPDRAPALRKQLEDARARRDRALLQFRTYGLPQYSLEAEAVGKEVERLERELAAAEAEAR